MRQFPHQEPLKLSLKLLRGLKQISTPTIMLLKFSWFCEMPEIINLYIETHCFYMSDGRWARYIRRLRLGMRRSAKLFDFSDSSKYFLKFHKYCSKRESINISQQTPMRNREPATHTGTASWTITTEKKCVALATFATISPTYHLSCFSTLNHLNFSVTHHLHIIAYYRVTVSFHETAR